MLRKTLFLLLATALLFATAGPASAGNGYGDEDTIAVSDSTVVAGQPITVTACCFAPGSTVTFTLEGLVVGTATADANGVATLTFTMPDLGPGTYRLEASGTGADGQPLVVSTTLTVGGTGRGAGSGALPTTGSDSSLPMSQIGIGAVAGGGLLVLLAKKRRDSRSQATPAGV